MQKYAGPSNTTSKAQSFLRWIMLMALVALALGAARADVVPLSDDDMSHVTGQALFDMEKTTVNGFTFYTVSLDATLNMNTNIQHLQLGCNGVNGAGCDLDASNVSFGCASNNGSSCITPASSCTPTAAVVSPCTATTGGPPTSLLPFILNNPFIQIAIQNDATPTTRAVAGIRLGAASISGPLSFGTMTSFSGYLSATANLNLQAQNDVAITCGPSTAPCPGTAQSTNCGGNGCTGGDPADGHNFVNYNAPSKSLGLLDDYACASLFITLCAAFDSLTVNYGGVTRSNLPVEAIGNRVPQAFITGTLLGSAVSSIVASMAVNQSNGLPAWLINALIGAIQPSAELALDQQLATELGLGPGPFGNNTLPCLPNSCSQATVKAALDAYKVPFNVSNIHQINVTPGTPFGLSFENQPIAYPGYVNAAGAAQTVPTGWAMYAANATTLTISAPTSNFVFDIGNGAAKAGNIIGLPGPFQNCYGAATFC